MDSEHLDSRCPATGEIIWSGPVASAVDVGQAVEKARGAFRSWRETPLNRRIDICRAYASVLKSKSREFATLIAQETGKPRWEASQEVASMVGKIELSIAAQAERAGERHIAGARETVLRHRPHGILGVLGPYNFPGHLPNGHIVPALLAGNSVVFKPSELAPGVGAAIADTWTEAGLPPGVLTVVQGGRDTGAALAAAQIDGLLFTGSAETGMHLRRMFAERPNVIVALELGGNNPLVVWDGECLDVATIVLHSAYVTAGQRCSCARRLIVPDSPFGQSVVASVAELASRIAIGSWDEEPQPFIGPLISDRAADLARHKVGELIARGAKCLLPLDPLPGRSNAFVTPALLDVTGIRVPDEEIFAPVLQVIRVADFDAAIASANNTRFGLAAGLVSSDDQLWARFAVEIRAGIINRNGPTTGASGMVPFGGIGDSGNHHPSAYYAADYCAYPVASSETLSPVGGRQLLEGMLLR